MPLFGVMILFFLGLSLLIFVLIYAFVPKKTILEERLQDMTSPEAEASVYLERPPSAMEKFLGNLGGKIPLSPKDYNKYMKDMVAAGYRKELMPVFLGIKVLLLAGLPAAYVLLYALPYRVDSILMALSALALGIIGFLLPSLWLRRKVKQRQLRIFHDLPDVLDLMTVCVEAGLSMDAAILRIASDRQFRYSPLAKELKFTTYEIRAGKPREEAIRDFGERSMLDDLKSFTAMLIQTERLGTSLADSLRIHSDGLRTRRRQLAEEAAAKTAIKLLFPLVFLIMPALFVVMLMPALLRIIKIFSQI
jgi:tight adherence protein C